MHGEYKPPGGAFDRVNAALTGIPVAADFSVLTAGVTAALGRGAVLAGLTAEAVATAVRRALARASGWRDHDWRFIREEPRDPALHMALDEVLAREVAAGRRAPTLRIWEWSGLAVVIGSFQSLRNEVDLAEASRLGITVVRRISGGGAVFVEPGNTITYSLYTPESLVAGMSYAESYGYLDDWVIGALTEDLGVAAWYQPLNDIISARGKIAGAAQRRLASGAVLHHVTMSMPAVPDGWVRVCGLAELDEDKPLHADIGQCPVCLVRTDGVVYALRDECTHQAVPLSDGEVAGGTIECWLHGSRFELATGRALTPPATRPVAVYPVRIDGEDVLVRMDPDGSGPAG